MGDECFGRRRSREDSDDDEEEVEEEEPYVSAHAIRVFVGYQIIKIGFQLPKHNKLVIFW